MFKITDPATRFCSMQLKALGGRWTPATQTWTFSNLDDASDAMLTMYRSTLATPAQRTALLRMIDDGTAAAAWKDANIPDPIAWVMRISRVGASELLSAGVYYRKLHGRAVDDRPLEHVAEHFNLEAFERGVRAGRDRARKAGAVC